MKNLQKLRDKLEFIFYKKELKNYNEYLLKRRALRIKLEKVYNNYLKQERK